ncbi:hypothetical protein [Beijerinckia indica]|uniref:Uncharacterized protein n=1 Tax=Beijerinckia indica subsp. indica (strain ATCC 9039 / DSM 1715 / NCIMB 8712) TaxID=395963 RepID=B2IK48_BEII9|nr:hypothetical protein [Beijerinckia indica]ACB94980.1 hypothetical protein Bind_1340 [Beijerinckia indica subsp. indica ATCC 9039]
MIFNLDKLALYAPIISMILVPDKVLKKMEIFASVPGPLDQDFKKWRKIRLFSKKVKVV